MSYGDPNHANTELVVGGEHVQREKLVERRNAIAEFTARELGLDTSTYDKYANDLKSLASNVIAINDLPVRREDEEPPVRELRLEGQLEVGWKILNKDRKPNISIEEFIKQVREFDRAQQKSVRMAKVSNNDELA